MKDEHPDRPILFSGWLHVMAMDQTSQHINHDSKSWLECNVDQGFLRLRGWEKAGLNNQSNKMASKFSIDQMSYSYRFRQILGHILTVTLFLPFREDNRTGRQFSFAPRRLGYTLWCGSFWIRHQDSLQRNLTFLVRKSSFSLLWLTFIYNHSNQRIRKIESDVHINAFGFVKSDRKLDVSTEACGISGFSHLVNRLSFVSLPVSEICHIIHNTPIHGTDISTKSQWLSHIHWSLKSQVVP